MVRRARPAEDVINGTPAPVNAASGAQDTRAGRRPPPSTTGRTIRTKEGSTSVGLSTEKAGWAGGSAIAVGLQSSSAENIARRTDLQYTRSHNFVSFWSGSLPQSA